VDAWAETTKRLKYSTLATTHKFVPVVRVSSSQTKWVRGLQSSQVTIEQPDYSSSAWPWQFNGVFRQPCWVLWRQVLPRAFNGSVAWTVTVFNNSNVFSNI